MQLDVCAVFARTTNYSLGKSPFENAGPLNLDCPYLCNKQICGKYILKPGRLLNIEGLLLWLLEEDFTFLKP